MILIFTKSVTVSLFIVIQLPYLPFIRWSIAIFSTVTLLFSPLHFLSSSRRPSSPRECTHRRPRRWRPPTRPTLSERQSLQLFPRRSASQRRPDARSRPCPRSSSGIASPQCPRMPCHDFETREREGRAVRGSFTWEWLKPGNGYSAVFNKKSLKLYVTKSKNGSCFSRECQKQHFDMDLR